MDRTSVGDLPPPRLPTARGALRRSLAVWGWGQAATGRRAALGLALVEGAALAVLAWFGPPLIDGELAIWIFVAATLFVAAWATVAIAAYRRAVRRRRSFGLPGADGGAADLLWLAPVLIAGMMAAWGVGGTLARPEATLTRFVGDWRAGDGADAASLFASPLAAAAIQAAWERQVPRLRNRLLTLDAAGAPDDGIDPDHPLDSIRFVEVPAPTGSGPDIARIAVQVVRREDVSGSFLGLLPTSSQTLVPVADLGWIDLRLVHRPSGRAGVPDDPVWLIARIDLLGEVAPS